MTPVASSAETAGPDRRDGTGGALVRELGASDVEKSADLHARVLETEFITRLGPSFLRAYHRAWIDSPVALTLAVDDAGGQLAGALLGSLDPAEQVSSMLRRHGTALAARLLLSVAVRPRLAVSLVRTRLLRYARGVARFARASVPARRAGAHTSGRSAVPGSGEVTHLFVDPSARGKGFGKSLLDAAAGRARAAGLPALELVTPPDFDARGFYERLGWQESGKVTSRSGEEYVRYRLPLG